MAKKSTEYRWKIYRLRGTPAAFIGAVVATDEQTAIKSAIEEFGIDDPSRHDVKEIISDTVTATMTATLGGNFIGIKGPCTAY
jgi:hypothetical protein